MNDVKYESIIEYYEDCLARHGDSHLGVDWPNMDDAIKRYRVMLEIIKGYGEGLTLLDFGCGASHLYRYLLESNYRPIKYYGLDASEAFCELSRKKYPSNEYACVDILKTPDKLIEYDYVVMNGVFTEKRALSFDEMFEYLKNMLRTIFPKVRCGLAFNVMSKLVDWERDDLFHLPVEPLIEFLSKELSRNFVIRSDYGLYEYTVYLYRDQNNG
jgi:SAM-dependent methyltransferase